MMEATLLELLLRVTVWLGAVCLIVACLRRATASTRHLVWAIGVVGALVMPLVSAGPGLAVLPAAPATASARPTPQPPMPGGEEQHAKITGTAPVIREEESVTPVTAPAAKAMATPPPTTESAPADSAINPWIATWILGATLMLAHLLLALYRVARSLRTAQHAPVELRTAIQRVGARIELKRYVDPRIVEGGTAWTFGSVVALPSQATEWNRERLESVLAHELSHIRRRDWITNLLGRVLRAALWFHPLAWFATARMHAEQERACDDAVLRTGVQPSSYAANLTAIATAFKNPSATAYVTTAIARRSELFQRVHYLLDASRQRRASRAATVLLLGLGVITAGLTGTARRAEAITIDNADVIADADPVVDTPILQDPKKSTKAELDKKLEEVLKGKPRYRKRALRRFMNDDVDFANLLKYVRDPRKDVALHAVAAVSRIRNRDDEILPTLLAFYAEAPDSSIRGRLMDVFGRNLDRKDVSDAIARRFWANGDREVLDTIVNQLGAEPLPAEGILTGVFDGDSEQLMRTTARTLARAARGPGSARIIRYALSHPNLRARAVMLGKLWVGSGASVDVRDQLAALADDEAMPDAIRRRSRILLGEPPKTAPLVVADYSDNAVRWLDGQGKQTRILEEMYGVWDAEPLANGNILVTEFALGRIVELDKDRKEVWSYDRLKNPYDADRLPNGNTLIADTYANRVIEVDSDEKIVWEFEGPRPIDVERLDNGNTLIADGTGDRVIEVNAAGEIVWKVEELPGIWDVDRLPNGNTLLTQRRTFHRVIEVDRAGKVLFEISGLQSPSDADRMPNGHTVIAQDGSVEVYDATGGLLTWYPCSWSVEVNALR